jgi:hypothetical protein
LAGHSGVKRNGPSDTKKALEWTVNAKGVLNQLSGVISKTNKAWEGFISEPDGGIGYFSDMVVRNSSQSRALLSFNNTKEAFKTLEALKEKLGLLDESCSTLGKNVSGSPFRILLSPSSWKEVLLTLTAQGSVNPRKL